MVMKLKNNGMAYHIQHTMAIYIFLQYFQKHDILRQVCNNQNLDEKNNEGKIRE